MADDKIPMRTLRTSVPPEVFARIETEATKRGMNMAQMTRALLTDWMPPQAPDTWPLVRSWLTSRGVTLDMLKNDGIETTRSGVTAWARANGFDQ